MLNLNKRVNKLLENTTSLESKNVCKEVLETYTTVPEEQLSAVIVEKLKRVKDADKHVSRFIQLVEKYMSVKDLGISTAISNIKESQAYHYPTLKYALDKFERFVVENVSQDFLIVEEFMTTLNSFTWDTSVNTSLKSIKERFDADKEHVLVSRAIYELQKTKGNFLYEAVVENLESHFENPTSSSRSALIESLSKFTFNPTVKKLQENLKKIQSSNGSMQIISQNENCDVNAVYSPIVLENGKEYFTIKGDVYKKLGTALEKVSIDEFRSLSESIQRSYDIINSPHFFVKEGKASFYVGRNKVEIFENDSKTAVKFNGKVIPAENIARNLVSTGMFRMDEAKVASDIQFITDIFENFYEVDFAKVISSKRYPGSYVTIMKINEEIYLNKVNTSMMTNEFFSSIRPAQARDLVLEFLGYDITESLTEFIQKDKLAVLEIKNKQVEMLKNMSILEAEMTKINGIKKDPYLSSSAQVKQLEEMLTVELQKLKLEYGKLSEDLRQFEAKTSDSGIIAGQDVKIIETGELATVSGIDSNNHKISVVTANGKTKTLPLDAIESLEDQQEQAYAKNKEKGEELKEEELSPASIVSSEPSQTQDDETAVAINPKDEDEPEYVKATVSSEQEGSCAGKEVNVVAADYTSKGNDELLQVECDGELYFIEKKFIKPNELEEGDDSLTIDFNAEAPSKEEPAAEEPAAEEPAAEEPAAEEPAAEEPTEEEPAEEPTEEEEPPTPETIKSKLATALEALEKIRDDMNTVFTSNESISSTINGVKGLIDAMSIEVNESSQEAKAAIDELHKEVGKVDFKQIIKDVKALKKTHKIAEGDEDYNELLNNIFDSYPEMHENAEVETAEELNEDMDFATQVSMWVAGVAGGVSMVAFIAQMGKLGYSLVKFAIDDLKDKLTSARDKEFFAKLEDATTETDKEVAKSKLQELGEYADVLGEIKKLGKTEAQVAIGIEKGIDKANK